MEQQVFVTAKQKRPDMGLKTFHIRTTADFRKVLDITLFEGKKITMPTSKLQQHTIPYTAIRFYERHL